MPQEGKTSDCPVEEVLHHEIIRLGGVHRGAESSEPYTALPLRAMAYCIPAVSAMDISADLHELTRCPVGLVSAGVKSILDIGRLVFNGLFDD